MERETIRNLIRDYDVGYHVRQELGASAGSLAPIGYSVELTATHGQVHDHPVPGCPECQPVARALKEIADQVTSAGDPNVACDIHVDTARHDFDFGHAMMTATITMLPLNASPLDTARRVVDEVVAALREAGAKHRA